MTDKTTEAIVRGPMPYFGKDGVLYMPGQIVRGVPSEDVSDEGTREVTVQVEARNGDLRDRKVEKRSPFMPLKKGEPTIAEPVDTATVATGQPDRLNVTDFLKGGDDDVIRSIVSGSVDDHLGVIEQAVLTGRGKSRERVKDAVMARRAAIARV